MGWIRRYDRSACVGMPLFRPSIFKHNINSVRIPFGPIRAIHVSNEVLVKPVRRRTRLQAAARHPGSREVHRFLPRRPSLGGGGLCRDKEIVCLGYPAHRLGTSGNAGACSSRDGVVFPIPGRVQSDVRRRERTSQGDQLGVAHGPRASDPRRPRARTEDAGQSSGKPTFDWGTSRQAVTLAPSGVTPRRDLRQSRKP